jgi:hypothetical protein
VKIVEYRPVRFCKTKGDANFRRKKPLHSKTS